MTKGFAMPTFLTRTPESPHQIERASISGTRRKISLRKARNDEGIFLPIAIGTSSQVALSCRAVMRPTLF